MVRLDVLVRADQKRELENFPGNSSEHIRQAIDDYILKKKLENKTASTSPLVQKTI